MRFIELKMFSIMTQLVFVSIVISISTNLAHGTDSTSFGLSMTNLSTPSSTNFSMMNNSNPTRNVTDIVESEKQLEAKRYRRFYDLQQNQDVEDVDTRMVHLRSNEGYDNLAKWMEKNANLALALMIVTVCLVSVCCCFIGFCLRTFCCCR